MATTKLKIRNDRSQFEKTTIYVQVCIDSKIKMYSTGQKIEPGNWEPKQGRVKKGVKGASAINTDIEHELEKYKLILRKANIANIVPTFAYIESELEKIKPNETVQLNFFGVFDLYIKECEPIRAKSSLKHYRTTYNNLKGFEKAKKHKLTFEGIDRKFYGKFVNYLVTELGYQDNTIGNQIKNIKAFLSWATGNGYNSNEAYKEFEKPSSKTEIITLTKEELDRIATFQLSHYPKLDRVRDLFVFECTTGIRFSDLSNLKPENIKDDHIDFTTVKTRDRLVIGLNAYSRSILNKYNGGLPNVISNQKMNDYLKELGKLCGIDSTEHQTKFIGSKRVEVSVPKYELITTHTARRTFITQSLERGVRPESIMMITGHKDIKTMMKYVKVTRQVANIELSRAWNDAPSQMKVS
jgi:site-specific recombinase XerD